MSNSHRSWPSLEYECRLFFLLRWVLVPSSRDGLFESHIAEWPLTSMVSDWSDQPHSPSRTKTKTKLWFTLYWNFVVIVNYQPNNLFVNGWLQIRVSSFIQLNSREKILNQTQEQWLILINLEWQIQISLLWQMISERNSDTELQIERIYYRR